MRDLKLSILRNYVEHPAFQFIYPSWGISEKKLLAFNKIYAVSTKAAATLSRRSFYALRQECLQIIVDIFDSMLTQADDEYEKYFLIELQAECVRLIHDELDWYARAKSAHFIQFEGSNTLQSLIEMQTYRYFFGQLSNEVVEELRRLTNKEVNHLRMNAQNEFLTREDLSINSGKTIRAVRNILNIEFRKLGVLDAIGAYAGRKTKVVGVALELSVPQATWWQNSIPGLQRPPHTLYAHLDETISCPKSIIYLTDVTELNGPTGCYPGAFEAMKLNSLQDLIGRVVGTVGTRSDSPLKEYYSKQYHQSINSENFRRHFMRLPECLRFNSHMGWDVLPGSELESELFALERKMTGPAGTFIAFDGACLLHRGGLIQQGERLALQVIFSDLPFAKRAMGKIKRVLA